MRLARLDVERLFISANNFIGCMPFGLRDITYHDLDQRPNPGPLPDCPNEAPTFTESSYSLTVSEDSAVGHMMGKVSAEDPDGRSVEYAITTGNEDGKFGIDSGSGELSVAGELDQVTTSSYALTVEAVDGNGATSEAMVSIQVTGIEGNTEETTEENSPSEDTGQSTDAVVPPAPLNLTATLNEDGSITLSWDAPDDDTITGYQILRRRPTLGEETLEVYVEDTGSTETAYTDIDVTPGARHVYRVKAINSAGVGEQSNFVRVES